ncbi:DAZ-associated protein 1 [Sorochytrium milnesiophthora]
MASLVARLHAFRPFVNYVATQKRYWEITEEQLATYFSKFGQVDEVLIIHDPKTHQKRNFGFIFFKDPAVAAELCPPGQGQQRHRHHIGNDQDVLVQAATPFHKRDLDKYNHHGFTGFLPSSYRRDGQR